MPHLMLLLYRAGAGALGAIPSGRIRKGLLSIGTRIAPVIMRVSSRHHIPILTEIMGSTEVRNHSYDQLAGMWEKPRPLLHRIMSLEQALFTGRAICILNPELSPFKSEKDLKMFMIQRYKSDVIDSIMKRLPLETQFLKIFAHEVVHHLILRGTSLLALIDMLSWKERIEFMYVTDKFHTKTGFPRVVDGLRPSDRETTLRILAGYERQLSALSDDKFMNAALKDSIAHFLFIYLVYPEVIVPIVEGITWAILEDWVNDEGKLRKMLDTYFNGSVEDYEHTHWYVEKAKKLLDRGWDVEKLIGVSNRALNVPLAAVEEMRQSKGVEDVIAELREVTRKRFEVLSEGGDTQDAPEEDKKFATIARYLVDDSYDLNLELSGFIAGVLSREPEVLTYIGEVVPITLSGRVYEDLTVYLNSTTDKGMVLRYDPYANLPRMDSVRVRATGRPFRTLEDIVGDFPLTHRTFLTMLCMREESESIGRRFLPSEAARRYIKCVTQISEVFGDLGEQALQGRLLAGDYLEAWLYYILGMGDLAPKITGLHGLW